MSKATNAIEEQLERIQTEISETADPERLKFIATELVSTLKQLSAGPHLSGGVLMIPHYLSDITEEPEPCQYKFPGWGDQCENWALAGEYFCADHVD